MPHTLEDPMTDPSPPVAHATPPEVAVPTGGSTVATAKPMPNIPEPLLSRPPVLPKSAVVPLPPAVLPAVGVAGLAAAALLPLDRPAVGWVLVGLIAGGAVYAVHRKSRAVKDLSPARVFWAVAALALLAVGAFRSADWLFELCVVAACVAGSLAVVGRRSASGLVYDVLAVPLEALRSLPWLMRGTAKLRPSNMAKTGRTGVAVLISVSLLAVFIPLLAGADEAFAQVLAGLMPEVDGSAVVPSMFAFGLVALGTAGACYVLAAPPGPAVEVKRRRRQLDRVEWALPVGVLVVLFAAFVAVQFVTLFGGDAYVLQTSGLRYADYARTGFHQLVAITVLTLAVISTALRWAPKETAGDRAWLRALLGGLSVLTLVIVASALGRMWTYQQAYGFTVLRLLVEAAELWLGALYLLMLVALIRLEQRSLSRAVIGTAVAGLLVLAAINPERVVADRNIDRFEQTRKIDLSYLRTLSPDAAPALTRLPDAKYACVTQYMRLPGDSWWEWNLARSQARDVRPAGVLASC
jgi:hypothetical protein